MHCIALPLRHSRLAQHLFKMMYRLLTCHTDLRDRLAHWAADIEVADAVVNEVRCLSCQRLTLPCFPRGDVVVHRRVH